MRTVMSIDPGWESGVVVALCRDDYLPLILAKRQVEGGLAALEPVITYLDNRYSVTDKVCESFSPRPGSRSWRLRELEPLRIEGWLYGQDPTTVFRRPEARKLINGSLSSTRGFLGWSGYWTLPSQVGRPDANDTNSAMMHLFGYLRDRAHMPTIQSVIEYGDHMHREDV